MTKKLDAMKALLEDEAAERASETTLLRMMGSILSQEIAERANDSANIEKTMSAAIARIEKLEERGKEQQTKLLEKLTAACTAMERSIASIEAAAKTPAAPGAGPHKPTDNAELSAHMKRIEETIKAIATTKPRVKELEFVVLKDEMGEIRKIVAKEI